jgi:ribosomal protein S18 acetylase RimI-like enzyme
MHVRKAQKSDLDDLILMNLEVHSIHLRERPDEFINLSSDDVRSSLPKLLTDKDYEIFVCLEGEELIGYVLSRVESRKESPVQKARQHFYIEQIDVKREHRRRGAGELLLNATREMAKKRGIDVILLDVWNFNEGAVAFFKSQGFSPWIQRMGMTVD